ncbi:MAG: hypothetical protein RBT04_08310 [Sphaerochaetaceae bacterium]|jgi:hypothetical protein|nr:hypothetical protein [Sphaerochaetaceae bacterium]
MKKITKNIFTENPNVEAFILFHGTFSPFYISINKGAPIEKRIKSIFKPDGYAWVEDIAYDCFIIVVPQSKKAYDAFISYFLSDPLWTESLRCLRTEVLPYERSSFREMKGGMYFYSEDDIGKWNYSFASFRLGLYYDDGTTHLPFFDEEIPQYVSPLMRSVVKACSHLSKDQEEKVKEISAILWNIYGETYGHDISTILG